MQLSHILKRLVPFVGAIVIGVFIAGLFFSAPASNSGSRAYEELRRENARLRAENCRLKRQVREVRHMDIFFDHDLNVPEPPLPPVAPVPPAPPAPPLAPMPPAPPLAPSER